MVTPPEVAPTILLPTQPDPPSLVDPPSSGDGSVADGETAAVTAGGVGHRRLSGSTEMPTPTGPVAIQADSAAGTVTDYDFEAERYD